MKGIQKGIQFKTLLNRNRYGLYLHEYQAYDLLKKYKLPLVPVIVFFKTELQSQHS